jgi:hypothetical protein
LTALGRCPDVIHHAVRRGQTALVQGHLLPNECTSNLQKVLWVSSTLSMTFYVSVMFVATVGPTLFNCFQSVFNELIVFCCWFIDMVCIFPIDFKKTYAF